jgi:carboxyl-terminal processing protease
MKRMEESKVIYQDVLKHHLITRSMSFNTDYEKAPYAKSTAELKDRWRKQLKLSTLSSLTDRLKLQEDRSKGIVNKSELDSLSKLKQNSRFKFKRDCKDTDKVKTFAN